MRLFEEAWNRVGRKANADGLSRTAVPLRSHYGPAIKTPLVVLQWATNQGNSAEVRETLGDVGGDAQR
jgi:hypothetical protein